MFDIRTGLYDAQCWSADWKDRKQIDNLKNSMNFTHEEAKVSTPVSACGIVQGVAPTVRFICCLAVTNFINFVGGNQLRKQIVATPFILGEESVMAF